MKKAQTLLPLLALCSSAVLLSSSANAQAAYTPGSKLKACFIYVGPVGDYGWSNAHDAGRKAAMKAYPWLETKFVEAVPEAQAEPYIDRYVKEGCNVIFTTSFGYMDATLASAKKYPNVMFAHATGFQRLPNVLTYTADFYQLYYLNGMMAAALSKTGKLGYIGAFPIPEVKRHISAFALGARAVNPKATVNVKWINAWFDPNAAKAATESLIAEGNDTFAFTEDTPTVMQVAAKAGLNSFSHYSPMLKFAPNNTISGQLVDWGVLYKDVLGKVYSGKYSAKNLQNVDYWWLLSSKSVLLGADFNLGINSKFRKQLQAVTVKTSDLGTQSVFSLVNKRLAQMSMAKPTFDPFTGPIMDRKGVERVAKGKVATVAELNSIQWAAQGVVGEWADEPK